MDIAVVGGGGREHVLADVLSQSDYVRHVYGLPGTLGFDNLNQKGTSVPGISATDTPGIVAFARQENLGLVVIGPEAPLMAGLSDALRAEGIPTFGPSQYAAQLEGNKIFGRKMHQAAKLLHPPVLYEAHNRADAKAFGKSMDSSLYVVKLAGLARGKGVLVVDSNEKVDEFIDDAYDGRYGKAAVEPGVLYEVRLPITAPEVSAFSLYDSRYNRVELPPGQDYKREFDGDKGRNTGGVGAYSPLPIWMYTPDIQAREVENDKAYAEALERHGIEYVGVNFKGLMILHDAVKIEQIGIELAAGAYRLEDNVRFGDPEAAVVLTRLQRAGVDIFELIWATVSGKLDTVSLPDPGTEAAVAVVLTAENYPGEPVVGDEIHGLLQEYENVKVYEAGTADKDGTRVTDDGRVATVVGFGENIAEARQNAYNAIGEENNGIHWRGMHNRTDIGNRALEEAQ